MEKIIISGSAKSQDEIQELIQKIKTKYEILDYPKTISKDNFIDFYPKIHKAFYESIANTNVFLLFNCDKKDVKGYIGAAGFAELCFAVAQNQLYKKNLKIYIYKMPDQQVGCFDEIKLYLQLGWISLWGEKE